MNAELPVCPVRESGTVGVQQQRSRVQGAVWSLTGIIKIRADDEERRERAECEKAKLTQTLSITFHLTLSDDNVDTADNGKSRHPDFGVSLPVSASVEHHWVEGLAPQLRQRRAEMSCLFKASIEKVSHILVLY